MYARESLVWSIEMYIEDEGAEICRWSYHRGTSTSMDKVLGMMSRLFLNIID